MIDLLHGDCLEIMPTLPAQSFDAIIADIPYGTTACSWDTVIPFAPMWENLKRLAKPRAAIVLFGSQPFTSALVMSNPQMFRYEWIWRKNTGSGFAISNYQPLRYHESILVFSFGSTVYNPIPTERFSESSKMACSKPIRSGAGKSNHISGLQSGNYTKYDSETKKPESVLDFKSVPNGGGNKLHPTQKPVALLEYLIKTYTNEGDTVLDFTMGSGTTMVAAVNTKRNGVGIELREDYYNIAQRRVKEAQQQMVLI